MATLVYFLLMGLALPLFCIESPHIYGRGDIPHTAHISPKDPKADKG